MTGTAVRIRRGDRRTACGICGARTRFVGSHVLAEHVGYTAGPDAIAETLRAERIARMAAVR